MEINREKVIGKYVLTLISFGLTEYNKIRLIQMKKELYLSFFGQKDLDEIKKIFLDTLLETNHEYNFFVDWKKVKEAVEKYAIELNILNSLIKNHNFDEHLRKILSRYPEVLPCFPLLLAIRDSEIKIVDDFMASEVSIDDYDFSRRELSDEEIDQVIKFVAKTGLKGFFQELSKKNRHLRSHRAKRKKSRFHYRKESQNNKHRDQFL